MRIRALLLPSALLLALPVSASAQLALETRVTLASAFVWRGLTVVNRPVIQPEVTLSAGPAALGLWTNIEPVRYTGEDDLSALGGRRAPGVTEVDPFVEVSREVGGISVAAGAIGYLFTHAAGYETLPNTAEVYGRFELGAPLPLELAAYYDLHAVRGLYLEAGVEHPLPGWRALVVGARIGAGLGEAAGPETVYFERDGLTHVDLSARMPLKLGSFELSPFAHVGLCVDPAARVVAPERTRRAKLWGGFSLGWPAAAD